MDLVDKYRAVFFGSEIGKEVLGDILNICHLGCSLTPDNPAMTAEHNVGTIILSNCGVFSEGTASQVINAFAAVVPDKEENDDDRRVSITG